MKNSKEIREKYLIAEGCGSFNKYNETKYSLWLESELIRLSQQSSFFAVSQQSELLPISEIEDYHIRRWNNGLEVGASMEQVRDDIRLCNKTIAFANKIKALEKK